MALIFGNTNYTTYTTNAEMQAATGLRTGEVAWSEESGAYYFSSSTSGLGANDLLATTVLGSFRFLDDQPIEIADNGQISSINAPGGGGIPPLSEGHVWVGDADGMPTEIPANVPDHVLIGDGVSANPGLISQINMIPNNLTFEVAGNLFDDSTEGAFAGWIFGEIPGGATSNKDIPMTHDVRVLGYKFYISGAGAVGDNVQLTNGTGANHISNSIDLSAAFAGQVWTESTNNLDTTHWEISSGGTLRVTLTDGGGATVPAIKFAIQIARVNP